MSLTELFKKGPFILDGGMGTMLQQRGLRPGEAPEGLNLLRPDDITAVHRAYYEAGSQMVLTNTFGVHPLRYSTETCRRLIGAAVACADKARAGMTGERFIALDIGPSGKLLKPLGDLDFEDAVRYFGEIVRMGADQGVDCVFIETMNDSRETRAALLATKESSSLPVMVSNVYGADGKLLTGGTPEGMVAMLEGLGADAVGVNCSLGPAALRPVIEKYLACASVPVLLKPNAGLPVERDGQTVYDIGPEEFAAETLATVPQGLRIVGGCCGTTPGHISALAEQARGLVPPALEQKRLTVAASPSRAVYLGQRPVVIGERINPTGKKRFRQALAEGDMEYLLNEALTQEERGADILDVNVGAPGISEPEMLERAVSEIQAVSDLPLQLDTADPKAMERALRAYNGKAMINSVTGSEESLERVLPLAKKYGGVLVALTLDEKGIPPTPEGRLQIAQRILERARAYGIPEWDVVFDPLTLTVSAENSAPSVTLESLRLIAKTTGRPTVLGVSNVSFGLPERELIGSAFLTMALMSGLSAAIINPLSDRMMGAFRSYETLTGADPNCGRYIAFCGTVAQTVPAGPAAAVGPDAPALQGLSRAVQKGLVREAGRLAQEALDEGRDGMALISEEIIPALDRVGTGFEQKTIFLPQLMMAAEAAESAFRAIRSRAETGSGTVRRAQIVLATVRGDVHDIGKNIVRLLMENYGFRVTDLGRDVLPEKILDTVLALQAPLCGLSALMTTTLPAMEETVRLLKAKAPFCRIIVGGAVLTEKAAKDMGADGYGKDAMAAVRLAEKLTEGTDS